MAQRKIIEAFEAEEQPYDYGVDYGYGEDGEYADGYSNEDNDIEDYDDTDDYDSLLDELEEAAILEKNKRFARLRQKNKLKHKAKGDEPTEKERKKAKAKKDRRIQKLKAQGRYWAAPEKGKDDTGAGWVTTKTGKHIPVGGSVQIGANSVYKNSPIFKKEGNTLVHKGHDNYFKK